MPLVRIEEQPRAQVSRRPPISSGCAVAFDYFGGYTPGLAIFGVLTAVSAILGFGCRPPAADPRDDTPP